MGICWFCLSDTAWDDSPFVKGVKQCNHCHMPQSDNGRARADRFMALVNSVECGLHSCDTREEPFVHYARERAEKVLRDIESAVEAGALFGEGEKP